MDVATESHGKVAIQSHLKVGTLSHLKVANPNVENDTILENAIFPHGYVHF